MDQAVARPHHSRAPGDGSEADAEGSGATDGRDTIEVRSPREAPETKNDAKPSPKDEKGDDEDGDDKGGDDKDGDSDKDDKGPHERFAFLRKHPFLSIGGAILLVAAIIGLTLWYLEARHFESSDDAFVDARQFSVAPRVSGLITEVHVSDNMIVKEGDLLFKIDPRDYQVALAQAQAQLGQAEAQIGNVDAQIQSQKSQVDVAQAQVEQANAALIFAKQEEQRALELVAKGAGTLQAEQQRRSSLTQAQADSARAQASFVAAERQVASLQAQRRSAEANRDAALAQVDRAKLNLSYTDVKAAQRGTITRLTGAVGQYVQIGQAVTMFVPGNLWVTANFKETQITDMRPGQKVTFRIDAYPNRKIDGHIDSIQHGSGTAFSLLPAENATGNYVKVVQRVPVKIVFDNVPDDVTLGPGMSVVPSVRVR